jgi:hypothetical protein
VMALPDETIGLAMPTRKPRKGKNSPEPKIDEDGIHFWFVDDPLKSEQDGFSDWGKGVWHTCVATALNTRRIIRSQVESRLDASDARLEVMATKLEQIEKKLERLLSCLEAK